MGFAVATQFGSNLLRNMQQQASWHRHRSYLKPALPTNLGAIHIQSCVRTLSDIRSPRMMTPMRYVFLVLVIIVSVLCILQMIYFTQLCVRVHQISLHFIVSLSNENYSQAMSIARLKERLRGNGSNAPHNVPISEDYYLPKNTSRTGRRANAAIVMLGEYPLSLCLSQYWGRSFQHAIPTWMALSRVWSRWKIDSTNNSDILTCS